MIYRLRRVAITYTEIMQYIEDNKYVYENGNYVIYLMMR